jgi:hypothetical protein
MIPDETHQETFGATRVAYWHQAYLSWLPGPALPKRSQMRRSGDLGVHPVSSSLLEGDGCPYLDDEPPTAVVEVHLHLVEPQAPALKPLPPGGGLVSLLGFQPACDAEDLITALVLGHLEDAIAHAPAAAYGKRGGIAGRVELGHTLIFPVHASAVAAAAAASRERRAID